MHDRQEIGKVLFPLMKLNLKVMEGKVTVYHYSG